MATTVAEPGAVPTTGRRGPIARGCLRGRRLVALGAVLLAAAGVAWWRTRPAPVHYLTTPVTRGAIVRSVTATGAVNPVVTVQVGAFVSGNIRSLECDYNTRVRANQRCAKIDPRPYQSTVDQSTADLASARAQLRKDEAALAYAAVNFERDSVLRGRGVVSQDQLDTDRSTLDQARAAVALDRATAAQRQAALTAARLNLQYTDIVSPVDGTVISRNVDVGQTVAASFQTPTLFLIAKDLHRMQVDASVNESDIGAVAVGQPATFTVEAYPSRTFEGRITQLRRAPISVQNVVTYDVVVAVDNPDLALLPGMTANTHVIVARRDSALRVPLAALRYTPGGVDHAAPGRGHPGAQPRQRVWVLRDDKPVALPIVTGLNDGTFVEVARGSLAVGDQVITGEAHGGASGGASGGTAGGPQALPVRTPGPGGGPAPRL